MKDQDALEILTQIFPFVGSENTQRQADQGPQVYNGIVAAIMLTELMNLGMAIMAAGDTIVRAGFLYLFVLQPAEFQTLFFHAGLEETATAAAAIIVGPVGDHINKIFFADDRFDHVSQIFGNRIAKSLAHYLTGVLDGKFNLEVLVPIGIDLESSFPDPLGIVLINILDDKVVLDVEFFQSCQD